jgi:hypothetical protein
MDNSESTVPPPVMTLTRKSHIGEITSAGDWCIDTKGRVIMACPVCAGVFVAKDHRVESESPLTLSPSVVTPREAPKPWRTQVLAMPCHHHFWIRDGRVIDAR